MKLIGRHFMFRCARHNCYLDEDTSYHSAGLLVPLKPALPAAGQWKFEMSGFRCPLEGKGSDCIEHWELVNRDSATA